jgi:hypothetical protein
MVVPTRKRRSVLGNHEQVRGNQDESRSFSPIRRVGDSGANVDPPVYHPAARDGRAVTRGKAKPSTSDRGHTMLAARASKPEGGYV